MAGELPLLDLFSLALYGAIAFIAAGFWLVVFWSFVSNTPVFEELRET